MDRLTRSPPHTAICPFECVRLPSVTFCFDSPFLGGGRHLAGVTEGLSGSPVRAPELEPRRNGEMDLCRVERELRASFSA